MERWMMGDPAKVCERLEEIKIAQAKHSKESKQERARRELEELFKESPCEQDQH